MVPIVLVIALSPCVVSDVPDRCEWARAVSRHQIGWSSLSRDISALSHVVVSSGIAYKLQDC